MVADFNYTQKGKIPVRDFLEQAALELKAEAETYEPNKLLLIRKAGNKKKSKPKKFAHSKSQSKKRVKKRSKSK